MMEEIFNMPPAGPAKGSAQWIEALVREPFKSTFEERFHYRIIMEAWVKAMQLCGNPDGAPRLRVVTDPETGKLQKESVPMAVYAAGGLG